MFVQDVIDSNGVTLQYLDVMLYDFDNMSGPINSNGVAFNLSNCICLNLLCLGAESQTPNGLIYRLTDPNTAQLAELLKVLFKEEGIEFDSNVYCDMGINI
ncbi:hypothetical protein EDD18DRAFT_1098380 [Armillaria luteobubalina]|uniref:Uncharacterized protein n=1 Tax=Armillaria luteobubalina TaxID=153913 RepID=A0AA39U048_9AGAR|nr:hypothetical protein EDD18DRAFT_1098380 [Armillaria luteobubalina]